MTTGSQARLTGPTPQPPNHIVSIREHRYKIARYYDADGNVPPQWEMYRPAGRPLERTNLAYEINKRPKSVQEQYVRLRATGGRPGAAVAAAGLTISAFIEPVLFVSPTRLSRGGSQFGTVADHGTGRAAEGLNAGTGTPWS